FNRERITVVGLQPLHLLFERRNRLRREVGGIGFEEHAVTDIDDEILLAAGRRGASHGAIAGPAILVGASGHRQRGKRDRRKFQSAKGTRHIQHLRASMLAIPRSRDPCTGGWLSERSVNLSEVLMELFKCRKSAENNRRG